MFTWAATLEGTQTVTLYVSLAAAALFVIGMSALLAIALGRAAAHEDALLEHEARRLLAARPPEHPAIPTGQVQMTSRPHA